MPKAAFVTVLLTGLSAVPCLAGDMQSIADEYVKSNARIGDRDLAIAALWLAVGLPDAAAGASPAPTDIEAVGKIQLLAYKIIGNGYKDPPPEFVAKLASVATMPAPKPKPRLSPVSAQNAELAKAMACEADLLMQTMQPGQAPAMKPGECANAVGTKDAVIQIAGKIIGNG